MKIWFMDIADFKQCFPHERNIAMHRSNAFSCNKWSALNFIIFFPTKSMRAFATRKKIRVCFVRITDLF